MRKSLVAGSALLTVLLVSALVAVLYIPMHAGVQTPISINTHDELRALGWTTLINITRGGDPPPTVLWDNTYGGTGDDSAQSALQASDGGFVFAGNTLSFGVSTQQAWVLRTNSNGGVQWSGTYGGTSVNFAQKVIAAGDGGFVVAGFTNSTGPVGYTPARGAGGFDAWLFKVSSSGSLSWEQLYGGGSDDYAYDVQKTTDGGYILAGATNSFGSGGSDMWLLKTDSDGHRQWNVTFGGVANEVGRVVRQATDGGFIIVGSTTASGSADVYVVKTDSSGNLSYSAVLGGTQADVGYGVVQTPDGGYVVEANTQSFGTGVSMIWLLKLNTTLGATWNQTYGQRWDTFGFSLIRAADGGLLVAGSLRSSGSGPQDVFVMKTDLLGNQIWNMTFGAQGNENATSISPTTSGGYIVAATTTSFGSNYDGWLICLGADFFFTPYVQNGVLNATMVAGLSQPHGPSGAANSLDTVAGMEVAEGLGAMKSVGFGQYFLDTDVSSYNTTSGAVTYTYSNLTNIITIGGPGVNQVTYRYFANPWFAPVYEVFNGSSGKFDIYSPTKTYYESNWVNSTADLLVIQSIYVAEEGRYVMYLGGFGGAATRAACLIMQLQGSGLLPFTLQGRAMIIQWIDSNANAKVDATDFFKVVEIVP